MAELLVIAQSSSHVDATKDRRGSWKRGDIVIAMRDGHVWSENEGLPKFVVVKCPQLTVPQVNARLEQWSYDVQFEILQSNLALDGHRVRLTNASVDASGTVGLTRARVEQLMGRWGAVFVSANAAARSVTFDISIATAAMSVGFWEGALPGITLSETDYVQATGVHTLRADYSQVGRWVEGGALVRAALEREVRKRIEGTGTVFVSAGNGATLFTVTRVNVRERMRTFISRRLGRIQRRRFCLSDAQVTAVVNAGGSITVTAAQLNAAVVDRVGT